MRYYDSFSKVHVAFWKNSEDAALVLSTHLIGDIEKVLDEVIFLKDGSVMRQVGVDELREETGTSVDAYFREAYKC